MTDPGDGNAVIVPTGFKYDFALDVWTQLNDFPEPDIKMNLFTLGGKLYAANGREGHKKKLSVMRHGHY